MSDRIVIVGGGHAGTQAAVSLGQLGFEGRIDLVCAESEYPYQRPPLSKKYLSGAATDEQILLRQAEWYRDKHVALHRGHAARDLDLDSRSLTLDNGDSLTFDQVLLATGGRLRRLSVPGADLPRVHYLRTAADARGLRESLAASRRLAVVGGGYIGLEVAATAREAGLDVVVLERQERLLPRVASPTLASAVGRLHRDAGVEVRCDAAVTALEGDGQGVRAVVLESGERIDIDVVVIGVGIEAETSLAEAAGLRVDDGIVVDEYCRSSHPCAFAAGDCTSHPNRFLRRRVRLESVPNATQQGRTAAASMLGQEIPHGDAPWFWSEQYSLRLQSAGLIAPDSRMLLRGDPASNSFAVFHVVDGRLMAMEALNRLQDFMLGRKLIDAQAVVDDALADEARPLKEIAERYLGSDG